MHPLFHKLVQLLNMLPGIGERSALRIAFHLLKGDMHFPNELGQTLQEFKRELCFCDICGGITAKKICEICSDSKRNQKLLCVVEEPGDILVIEKTGEFGGLYHVLMGSLSPLDGIGPEELRISELKERLLKKESAIEELFIATNPTLEGNATADYVHRIFWRESELRITRISHGLSTGSSIEFAETTALARSIRSRVLLYPEDS